MATNKDAKLLCVIFQNIYENYKEKNEPIDIFGRTIRILKKKKEAMEALEAGDKKKAVLLLKEAKRLKISPIRSRAERIAAIKAAKEGKSAANIIAAANQVGGRRRRSRRRSRRRNRRRRSRRRRGGKKLTKKTRKQWGGKKGDGRLGNIRTEKSLSETKSHDEMTKDPDEPGGGSSGDDHEKHKPVFRYNVKDWLKDSAKIRPWGKMKVD